MAYGWRPHAMLCRWALPSAVPANGCCLTAFWSVSAVPQGAAPSSACWYAPSYLRAGWLSCAGVCPLRVRSVCGLVTGALAWRLAEKVQKALGSAVNMWRVHWGQVRRAAVWYLVAVSLQEAGCSDQKQSAVAYTDYGCRGVRSGWGSLRSVCRKLDAATKSNPPWHILSPIVAAHHHRLHAIPLHWRCAQVKAVRWGPAWAKPEVCRL